MFQILSLLEAERKDGNIVVTLKLLRICFKHEPNIYALCFLEPKNIHDKIR